MARTTTEMNNYQFGGEYFDLDISQFNLDNENQRIYSFKPFIFTKCQTARSDSRPKPRSGHRIVCNERGLYCYGGYNPNIRNTDHDLMYDDNWLTSRPLFRELWEFNFATRTWKKLRVKYLPYKLASNVVILEGNIIMVYGGTGMPFGGHSSNDLFVCNLAESPPAFRKVSITGRLPEPRYGQAAFRVDHHLYVIGGTTGFEYSTDVHKFDLLTSQWDDVAVNKGLPNEPLGRYRHELVFYGSRVYVLGGGTSLRTFGFKELPVYDYIKNEWLSVLTEGDATSLNPYPKARGFHSAVQIPNSTFALIIGGYCYREVLKDCWLLDLKTLKWKNITTLKLQFPTYFHSSCITPAGKLYTFGGICEVGRRTHRTSNMYSAWVCIPKLKEICWEACLYYELFSYVNHENKNCLPLEFQKRFG